MTSKKILIDYSEYMRFLQLEQKYNELLEKVQQKTKDISGSGDSDTNLSQLMADQANNTSLREGVVKRIPSITFPPSATITNSKESSKNKKKVQPWYFIGVPPNGEVKKRSKRRNERIRN